MYSINIGNVKITFFHEFADVNNNTCCFIFKYYVINLGGGRKNCSYDLFIPRLYTEVKCPTKTERFLINYIMAFIYGAK